MQTNFTRGGEKSPVAQIHRFQISDTGPGFAAGFMTIQIPLCWVLSPATLRNRCNAMTQQGPHTTYVPTTLLFIRSACLAAWMFLHVIVCEGPRVPGRPLFLGTVLVSPVKLCLLKPNVSWILHVPTPECETQFNHLLWENVN